jgi:hypothetical protein
VDALHTYNQCGSLLCHVNNWCTLLLCRAPIFIVHNFGSCTNTRCAQFLCRMPIFRAHFSLRIVPCKILVCPHLHTSTPPTPLIKLSCNTIDPHCAHTNKIPLRSVNTLHTTHTIIIRVHTTRSSIMQAPLNLHHAMLNLVRTPMHQYFSRIATLHCATRNLVVQTCAPIFFVHYHFAPRNAKFKCADSHANIFSYTNIFRALPIYAAQCQI